MPSKAFIGLETIPHGYVDGVSENVFDYIFRHTFKRPYDMMKICHALYLEISDREALSEIVLRQIVNNESNKLGVAGNRGIQFSDEYKFLDDDRYYKIVAYGNGRPKDDNAFLRLKIANLQPTYLRTISTNAPTATKYTFAFDMQSHGSSIESQQVVAGEAATKPTDPTAEGYTFGGWYKEAACTNAFDFATLIYEATTVYAKWTAVEAQAGGGGT